MDNQKAYYVNLRSVNGQTSEGPAGPYSAEMIRAMVKDGQLKRTDLIFLDGDIEWRAIHTFSDLVSSTRAPKPTDLLGKGFDARSGFEVGSAGVDDHTPSIAPLVTWILLRPHSGTYLQEGPFSTTAIIEGLKTGRFNYSQFAWRAGQAQWIRLGDLQEFDRRNQSMIPMLPLPPPLPDLVTEALPNEKQIENLPSDHTREVVIEKQTPTLLGVDSKDLPPVEKRQSIVSALEEVEPLPTQEIQISAPATTLIEIDSRPEWEHGLESKDQVPQVDMSAEREAQLEKLLGSTEKESFENPKTEFVSFSLADMTVNVPAEAMASSMVTKKEFAMPQSVLKQPEALYEEVSSAKSWQGWGRRLASMTAAAVAMLFAWQAYQNFESEVAGDVNDSPAHAAPQGIRKSPPAIVANSSGTVPETIPGEKSEVSPAMGVPGQSMATSTPVVMDQLKVEVLDAEDMTKSRIKVKWKGAPATGTVRIHAGVGEVLGALSVKLEQAIKLQEPNQGTLEVRLDNLQLGGGHYTGEVVVGEQVAGFDFFLGTKDAQFTQNLENHLRQIAADVQEQKESLFYSTKELDLLARELAEKYGQLKSQPGSWNVFFKIWKGKFDQLNARVNHLRELTPQEIAFPEQIGLLVQLVRSLEAMASDYQQGLMQKREIASDAMNVLIAELERNRQVMGELSVRSNLSSAE